MSAPVSQRLWTVLLALCALGAASASRASSVEVNSSGYYDNVVTTVASPLAVWDFMSDVAGTVTMSVTDWKLGDLMSALSTSVTLFDGKKLQLQGSNSVVFEVGAGQRFTTSIYSLTGGERGWSAYNVSLGFVPKASPVPLPLGGWLLLGGCGILATRMRRAHTNAGHATA